MAKRKRAPSKKTVAKKTVLKRRRLPSYAAQAKKLDDSIVTTYALDIIRGTIPAGPWVRLAAERHLRDLVDGPMRGLVFDATAAQFTLDFFPSFLKLSEGEFDAQPFELQAWQAFIVGSIFGWKNPDGFRRFRTGYIEVGKGNGKTPLIAGVGVHGLVCDQEPSAEIYSAATSRDQSKILWTDAKKFVEASPELQDAVRVSVNNLSLRDGYSFFRPVSSEHRGLDGKRVHYSLIDEVHECDAIVVEKMRAGMKGRRQPLQLEITNAGYSRTSVCWYHHDYSTRLLRGEVENDAWFAYVAAVDEADDPLLDESCWIKANPNLGVSIRPDYLRDQVKEARGIAAKENLVRRLNFCEWMSGSTRAIDLAAWDSLASFRERDIEGASCFGGLDLGQSDDFSAFVLIWLLPEGRVAVRSRFWLPEAALEQETARPYDAWARAGCLETTPGTVTDYDTIEAAVREDCLRYSVQQCAFDKRFAQQMAQHLTAADGILMVDQPQGFQLSEATTRLAELIVSSKLLVDKNPILTWMISNLVTRTGRFGELRPDKETSADKIDGCVAAIMALQRAISMPDNASIYEERGVLTF